MLKFILGRALSGKSYEICRQIACCVNDGKSPVLIIPEQFSFESEKRILSLLGDADAQKVKVLSFSRLCDEVENISGGFGSGELTDSEKIILMTCALKNVRGNLKYFNKYALSSGFSKMMLNTADEFTLNAVSPADILEAAEELKDGILGRKLYDTAVIFAEYNQLISEKLSGFEDRLNRLYKVLHSVPYFRDKSVFIDSFSGFTGQQYKIIDRIVSQATDTVVSFCDNAQSVKGLDIFTNIKVAKNRIALIAKKHGVKIADDTILPSGKYVPSGISAIEEFMCFGKTEREVEATLSVCCAQTAFDEARFVARNIRRIVREHGARYSDFVVIARNADDYEQALSLAFSKNEIQYFSDRRMPLISFPPSIAALSAMELTSRITTEKLFRFHKSGVAFLSEDELSELENYVYIWNIDGNDWQREWNMDPHGLDSNNATHEETEENIKRINMLRKRALAPITSFRDAFNGSPYDMAKAVVSLLESAVGKFSEISNDYNKQGNTQLSEGIVTAYSKVMKILDSIVNCLGSNASAREFKEAFKNCVNIESVGVVPQMVDEVLFGSADRIQPSRPHYVFILGANQGVFPRAPQANGVFSVAEIGKLNSLGIDIPDCSVYSAIDEDLLVYNCVCCADKKVFISYNMKNGEMSRFVKKLTERFCVTVQREPDILNEDNLPETADDTFVSLCRSEHGSNDYKTLKSALAENPDYKLRVEAVDSSDKRPQFSVNSELSRELLGKKISLSPSRFDTYSKCPFMYFCKYALGVKSIEPVSFSSMQSGTLIHYVLERFVEESKDRIKELTESETHSIIERLVNEYLDSFSGYREAENEHLKLMVLQMTETLKYLGNRLVLEFRQSDFTPEKCELIIREDGDIPPLELPVDDNVSVKVIGAVDRVDRYNGYIRIIDYKSGKREFKLPDILVGQNMQMLIYLYAVCSSKEYGGKPGGIFYMKAAMPDENTPASRRMNGFMPETQELIEAMDKSGVGEFIPLSSSRAKKTGATNEDFTDIFKFVELKLREAGRDISAGRFNATPIDGRDKKACEYCEFSSICRIEDEKPQRVESRSGAEVINEIKRQVSENGI